MRADVVGQAAALGGAQFGQRADVVAGHRHIVQDLVQLGRGKPDRPTELVEIGNAWSGRADRRFEI